GTPARRGRAHGPCGGEGNESLQPSPPLGCLHADREVAMSELFKVLGDKIKVLGSDWTKYSVVASFALYLVGYLTLRFHLTAMGLGTDLAVLDERYLFTGARFVIYLVSSVPNIVLVAAPIVAVVYGLLRLVPAHLRRSAIAWWSEPARLAV